MFSVQYMQELLHLRAGLCLLSVPNKDLIRFILACTIYSYHSHIFAPKYYKNSHTNIRFGNPGTYTFLGRVWQAARSKLYYGCLAHFKFKKEVCQTATTICSGLPLPHPTRSHSRIICRGREGPQGSNFTLRPAFQAKAWLCFIKKNPMHHKKQQGGCKEIQG